MPIAHLHAFPVEAALLDKLLHDIQIFLSLFDNEKWIFTSARVLDDFLIFICRYLSELPLRMLLLKCNLYFLLWN